MGEGTVLYLLNGLPGACRDQARKFLRSKERVRGVFNKPIILPGFDPYMAYESAYIEVIEP